MHCNHALLSERGPRERNEDFVYANSEERLFLIADGLGGYRDGHIASESAVQAALGELRDHLIAGLPISAEVIEKSLLTAHKHLAIENSLTPSLLPMATTLTVIYLLNDRAVFSHVGDCRLYLCSNRLDQITLDHTVSRQLQENGVPLPSISSHLSSVLTQCLGLYRPPTPQSGEIFLRHGDRLLLCSDGFYKAIGDIEIFELCRDVSEIHSFESLARAAFSCSPIDDNASGILIQCGTPDVCHT